MKKTILPQKSSLLKENLGPCLFRTLTQSFTWHFASPVAFSACSYQAGWKGTFVSLKFFNPAHFFLFSLLLQPKATNTDEYHHSAGLGEDSVFLDLQSTLHLDTCRPASFPASIQVSSRTVHVSRLSNTHETHYLFVSFNKSNTHETHFLVASFNKCRHQGKSSNSAVEQVFGC
jgi:hypothetical protein